MKPAAPVTRILSLGCTMDERGGGVACDEGKQVDLGARRVEGGALARVERFERVIASLGVVVSADGGDFGIEPGAFEDESGIDATEGCEGVGAVMLGIERAVRAFELAHRGIAVDRDNENVANGGGLVKIGDVAAVEEVETAVGEDHAATFCGGALAQGEDSVEIEDAAGWVL